MALKQNALRLRLALPYGAVALVAFLTYANTLRNGFIWDDHALILQSERMRSLGNVPRFFVEPFFPEGPAGESAAYYRPLVSASFALDYHAGGPDRPWVFHLTNMLLYSACAAAVYALYSRLIAGRGVALLAALLFACHALHTESVAWISGRTDVLAGLFMCLAFVVLLRSGSKSPAQQLASHKQPEGGPRRRFALPAAFVFLLLALFSKEVALSLVPIGVAFVVLSAGAGGGSAELRGPVAGLLALCAAAGVYLAVRQMVLGGVGTGLGERPFSPWTGAGAATSANCALQYLARLALPLNLSADFEVTPFGSVWSPLALLAIGGAAGLLVLSVAVSRRDRLLGFGLWWMWLSLLPVLHFVPISETAAERFAFVPSIGFCLVLGLVLERLLRSVPHRHGAAVVAVAAMLILTAGHGTVAVLRNRDWHTERSLAASSVSTAPHVARAHLAMGMVYDVRMGLRRRASQHYRRAVELAPMMAVAHNKLGRMSLELGALEEAVFHLKLSSSLRPDDPIMQTDLANALGFWHLTRSGRLEEAVEMFGKVEKLDPHYAEASYHKGVALQRLGRTEQAEAAYTEALRRRPRYYEPLYALALLHFENGELERALREAGLACTIKATDEVRSLLSAIKQELEGGPQAAGPARQGEDHD